ncbi:MAG: hypothetical protein GY778_28795 [bacterium]|nr:hypothetical protein [bacterium]
MRAQVSNWKAPDYKPIFEERTQRLLALRRGGPEAWQAVKQYYRTAPTGPVDFVEDWAVTYDPRKIPKNPHLPFMLFPRQREMILWFHQCAGGNGEVKKDGTVEKSRDTGLSWCIAAYATYLWLFVPGAAVGIGSYDADNVDQLGIPGSILEKCRIIIRNLPAELKPAGLKDSANGHLMHKRLVNPETGSTITGQIGDNIGRGDRTTVYFVDEAAHLKHAELVDASLSATSDCKLFCSTAYGPGGFFRKTRSDAYAHFRFHWTDDPRKDNTWYAAYRKKWGAVITAQEVDIDHEASVEDICIPATWITACRALPAMLPRLRPSMFSGVAGLDVADGGKAKSVFITRHGPIVGKPQRRSKGDTTNTAHWAVDRACEARVPVLNFDSVGVGAGVASTLRHTKAMVTVPQMEEVPTQALEDPKPEAELTIAEIVERASQAQDATNLIEPAPSLDPKKRAKKTQLKTQAINVGQPASERVRWADGKTSKEKFANTKGHIWWTLRDRAQKSFEHHLALTGDPDGHFHPLDELLLLPDDDDLGRQLSSVKYKYLPTGKIAIESKKELAARGIESPDEAEACSLTVVPEAPSGSVSKAKGFF